MNPGIQLTNSIVMLPGWEQQVELVDGKWRIDIATADNIQAASEAIALEADDDVGSRHDFCRSCGAPIKWVTMHGSKRAMPVDADPVERSFIVRFKRDGKTYGKVVPVFESHFSTCPNADSHRSKS